MKLPRLERRPELDGLRGLFLVWMTLTHLPTRFSDFVNQPIGFVSAAEGFVFMSALLVGRIYMRDVLQDASGVRAKLWKRSLKIYAYHLAMLAILFTVAAAFAVHTHKAAITNLINFYLAHPLVAIVGSVLLIYCPPLLDILPMYVTFLFFTPMLLSAAVRYGWRKILIASAGVGCWRNSVCATWYMVGLFTSLICESRCRKRAHSIFLPGRQSGFWACGSVALRAGTHPPA